MLDVAAVGTSGTIVSGMLSTLCVGTDGGTNVVTNSCNNAAVNQQFTLTAAGELKSGTVCLTAGTGTGDPAGRLTIATCVGTNAQQWHFTAANELRSAADLCIDLWDARTTPGGLLIMWRCHGGSNQRWTLVASPVVTPPATGSSSLIVSGMLSSLCFGTDGGTNVVTNACNSAAANEQFVLTAAGELKLGTQCLTAGAGTGDPAGRLTVAACVGSALQQWHFTAANELRSAADLCVDLWDSRTTPGGLLIMWRCHGGVNQRWTLVTTGTPPTTPTVPPVTTTPVGLIVSGYLSTLCVGTNGGSNIVTNTCSTTAANQQFTLTTAGELKSGTVCLTAGAGTGDPAGKLTLATCAGTNAQKWRFTASNELRNVSELCVDLWNAPTAPGAFLTMWSCHGGGNQRWIYTPVSTTTPTTPTTPAAVASVTVQLPDSLAVGATSSATAVVKDASGVVLTDRAVTWSSTNTQIATVLPTGATTAVSAGTTSIQAVAGGVTGTRLLRVVAPAGRRTSYYAAPAGSASGDGSLQQPWTMAAALAQPGALQPGDTIWLRGGTYTGSITSTLRGTASRPFVVRQYPGERAILDGGLAVRGEYAWFWGFEVMSSNIGLLMTGIDVTAPGSKFINMIVHDIGGNAFGVWSGAVDAELYGNVLYNNGRNGSQADRRSYGFYFQNTTGTMRLIDNIVGNTYGHGFHAYTQAAALNNLYLEGNVSFNAGSFDNIGGAEFLIGGDQPTNNLVFTDNYSYNGSPSSGRSEFGYSATSPAGSRITNNYLVGGVKLRYWQGLTFSGNTVVNADREMLEVFTATSGPGGLPYTFTNNTYRAPNGNSVGPIRWVYNGGYQGYSWPMWQALGLDQSSDYKVERASATKVVVRPNRYEPGRANIIVYNWSQQSTLNVDVSGVLQPGDKFEVREVQDYYGTPVMSGTYGGGAIAISMAPVTAVRPLGPITFPAYSTGREFHTFVLLKR